MNNSGAIYIAHSDHAAVAAEIGRFMAGLGLAPRELAPDDLGGRIMIPEKRRRHFLILPAHDGWVTIWEDPRYFADRALAAELARALDAQAVWVEVSGNGVGWARARYEGAATLEELYEPVETTFYGEYGVIHFVFDIETAPEDWIAALGLPYDELHYEAALEGELPADAGEPIHLAFEKQK